MLFKRVQYTAGGQELPGKSSVGTGMFGNVAITSKTTDANHTLTVAEMAGGVVYYSALSAGRNVTTPCCSDSGCGSGYGHWRYFHADCFHPRCFCIDLGCWH